MAVQSPARAVGVQSWCLRNTRDCSQVADLVRACGVEAVELCDVHADFGQPGAFARVVRTFERAGVRIVSLGVQTFRGQVEQEEPWFESAAIAGAKHISAHFAVDSFSAAVPATVSLCRKYDIRIGLHCHGGFHFGGQPDVLACLLKLGGDHFAVTLDTAWCTQIGPRHGDPVNWVKERFAGRISCVHYKDFIFDRRGAWQDVIVGTGNVDLPALLEALDETCFDGLEIVECDGHPENPVPGISECVRRIQAAGTTMPRDTCNTCPIRRRGGRNGDIRH